MLWTFDYSTHTDIFIFAGEANANMSNSNTKVYLL